MLIIILLFSLELYYSNDSYDYFYSYYSNYNNYSYYSYYSYHPYFSYYSDYYNYSYYSKSSVPLLYLLSAPDVLSYYLYLSSIHISPPPLSFLYLLSSSLHLSISALDPGRGELSLLNPICTPAVKFTLLSFPPLPSLSIPLSSHH